MTYKRPPDDIVRILDAAPPPLVLPSPDRGRLLLVEREPCPPVSLLARPYLSLAGVRVDPASGGERRTTRTAGFRLLPVDGSPGYPVRVPDDRSFDVLAWSPDGRLLALVRHLDDGLELWVADAATGEAWSEGVRVTDVLGSPASWTADGQLLALAVPSGRKAFARSLLPDGPRVEETDGKRAQAPTYQDLLVTEEDDRLFAHYASAQVVRVDPASGSIEELGEAGLITDVDPSPDSHYLLVGRLLEPFSHRVPWPHFAQRREVWDSTGALVRVIAERPVADEVPRQGVPLGPRAIRWQANGDATLVWHEALDGGDPLTKVPHRDRLLRWAAPFEGEPEEVLRMRHRVVERTWLGRAGELLLTEWDRDRRWRTTWLVDLAAPAERRTVFDLSVNDAYSDPGTPVRSTLPSGHDVALQDGDAIFLVGAGASEEGDRPFLDRLDLSTGSVERLFRSAPDAYERFVCFAGPARDRIVVERQTVNEPPNLLVRSLPASGEGMRLTAYADPNPQLTGASKRLMRYRRDDGVPLSGLLHLPPGWREGGPRVPLLLWAYPLDYSDPDTAGQVRGSERTFSRLEGATPLWLLLRGWAVLSASMPVVGDPETMNDTFVEQVVASARAAVDALDDLGIVDRRRVVASGHSYGGFMTATLLAHSDLFAAGIARSGAYNRTLTPFGFQTERRSYWEAPDVYQRVSPYAHANRIERPLLLIHGADDNNSGTYPMQSERLFQAIQGHGGTARLVVLPFEEHAYRARESILHVIAETFDWTDRHSG